MHLIKPGTRYDFMGMRKYFYALSAILLGASIVAMVAPGPNWGTDFKGGTEVELTLQSDAVIEPGKVREAVQSSGFAAPDVIAAKDASNRFLVRVQEVSVLSEGTKEKLAGALCGTDEARKDLERCPEALQPLEVKVSNGGDKITARYKTAVDLDKIRAAVGTVSEVQIRDAEGAVKIENEAEKSGLGADPSANTTFKVEVALKSKGDQIIDGITSKLKVSTDPKKTTINWIGAKASDQLRDNALKSILITLFIIMAYIAFRFDLRFAPGAIVSLLHDVLIAIGAMCVTRKEITLSTIAAILTVLGFSVTDTVVVYDRIRENLGKHRNMSFSEIVNLSVSEMFGRTILTSGTVALSMVCFLIFGTQVIKDFAFVLLVGIAVGTYSSIYVAAPLTEYIDRKFFAGKGNQRVKVQRTRSQKQADSVV
ncbi:MAG: protein translocase subunit SecF [Polyangiaceae bacterium]